MDESDKDLVALKPEQRLKDAMDMDPTLAQDLEDFRIMRDRAIRGDLEDHEMVPLDIFDDFRYKGKRLAPLQMRFVISFLRNPGKAYKWHAKQAGYSDWRRAGFEIMRVPHVLAALRHGAKYLGMRYSVTQSAVMGEIAGILFSDIGDVLDWDERGNIRLQSKDDIPKHKRKAVKSVTQTTSPNGQVTTKVEMYDKAPFAQLAARILQMDQKPTLDDVADAAAILASSRRRAIEAVKKEKPVEAEYEEVPEN